MAFFLKGSRGATAVAALYYFLLLKCKLPITQINDKIFFFQAECGERFMIILYFSHLSCYLCF